jgi:hypothetical protein
LAEKIFPEFSYRRWLKKSKSREGGQARIRFGTALRELSKTPTYAD